MLTGHFIPCLQDKLFITQFGDFSCDSAILCLPSITEELNLCRAVVAKQAQQFAACGLPCFVLDYYGCGDSEGEFEQACCERWLDNIITTGLWLKGLGFNKIILWGIRFGALLILANQQKIHQKLPVIKQILWKPVISGRQFSGQFLRIKQANALFEHTGKKSAKRDWRQHILGGNDVEVAGYNLTGKMLRSWELLQVCATPPLSPLLWLELAANKIPAVVQRLSQDWPDETCMTSVDCRAFWQIPEIFSVPELCTITLDFLLTEKLMGEQVNR
jgi:exosortase A-associated hydrolase 2